MTKCSKKFKEISKNRHFSNGDCALSFECGFTYRRLTPIEAAEMAHVHVKTAERWSSGTQNMQPAISELLFLKATGRILPTSKRIWSSVRCSNDAIVLACGERIQPEMAHHLQLQRKRIIDLERENDELKQKLAKQGSMFAQTITTSF
ncbi:MAG: hypothetical protein HRU20_30170 [Pseudomonadales bacterium]|nr:hypothetical protein [Pseudomonadales bacterium]